MTRTDSATTIRPWDGPWHRRPLGGMRAAAEEASSKEMGGEERAAAARRGAPTRGSCQACFKDFAPPIISVLRMVGDSVAPGEQSRCVTQRCING
jgi:hypothetical protein